MQPQPARTWTRDGYLISTDRARIDLDVVHRFLSTESYWARGIPRELVARSIEHALPFGLYQGEAMVGFARVITDFATVGYLGDVFVLPGHRGRGLSKWLMEVVFGHPDLQGFRRWILLTRDAHPLYAQYGFTPLAAPDRWMERRDRASYLPGGPPVGA